MLLGVNNAHRTEIQLNRILVMNTSNLITYVWNGEYIHVHMCAYGKISIVLHKIGWNS